MGVEVQNPNPLSAFQSNAAAPKRVRKTIAFDGTAGNGAVGTVALFTTTGRVMVQYVTKYCTETLEEAGATATIVLGTAGDTNCLGKVINATSLTANSWWGYSSVVADAPYVVGEAEADAGGALAIDGNVILTVGAQNVTNGTIVIDIWYYPITDDGALAAA